MLSITNLSKTYNNGVRALDKVNLEIGTGMFGLLGPNGAGKSTLMRTIAALQPADQGRILFEGVDIQKHPQHLRDCLGYLPQEFGVYPKMSAAALLDHIAVLKGILEPKVRKQQVEALLALTNLYEYRNRAVDSYSGGLRQRFGIAQALLGQPRLIIVDEPTAGLDPEERNRFYNLLSEIGEQIVVILSTHIVEDVRHLCSDMAVLAGGQVRAHGRPSALIAKLKDRVWRKVIAKSELDRYRESYQVLSSRLIAGRPELRVLADSRPDVGFEPVAPDLEDVYFEVLRAREGEAVTC